VRQPQAQGRSAQCWLRPVFNAMNETSPHGRSASARRSRRFSLVSGMWKRGDPGQMVDHRSSRSGGTARTASSSFASGDGPSMNMTTSRGSAGPIPASRDATFDTSPTHSPDAGRSTPGGTHRLAMARTAEMNRPDRPRPGWSLCVIAFDSRNVSQFGSPRRDIEDRQRAIWHSRWLVPAATDAVTDVDDPFTPHAELDRPPSPAALTPRSTSDTLGTTRRRACAYAGRSLARREASRGGGYSPARADGCKPNPAVSTQRLYGPRERRSRYRLCHPIGARASTTMISLKPRPSTCHA
jgi:hypothetical protein